MRKIFFVLIILSFPFFRVNGQQMESYTFCTGSSYAYLFDTAATTTSQYYARWNIGSTGYVAHFQNDTIYQGAGTGSGTGGYGSVKKWVCTSPTTASLVWTYTATNMHHDLCPMPNGNVLVLVRETKTAAQVSAIGGSASSGTYYFDIIREVKPTGATTGIVVWEWKLWDHLCQTVNSSITSTYVTSIAQNPQLWNINQNLTTDGFHPNGLDYNPTLDQIVFSSHNHEEIFIIDHSTTTAQAATHTGGNAGKGGDFLYRWGKPQNYGCTSNGNGITLNTIHDVRWIPATNAKWPNHISFFHNNGGGTVQVVLHLPPHNGFNYTYTPGSVIGPTAAILPIIPTITNVPNMGGTMVCENGNIIVTKPNTAFYEGSGLSSTSLQQISVSTVQADRLKKCEVAYPIPVASTTTASVCVNSTINLLSSATAPLQTSPSYTYSWSSTPAGFTSNLQNPSLTQSTPGNYSYTVTITSQGCPATATVNVVVNACTGIESDQNEAEQVTVYPNPASDQLTITMSAAMGTKVRVVEIYSNIQKIREVEIPANYTMLTIPINDLANGLYFIKVGNITRKIIISR